MFEPDLIPPPPIIRERLAETIRRASLLRSLLRLSLRAVDERADHDHIYSRDHSPRPEAADASRKGVAR